MLAMRGRNSAVQKLEQGHVGRRMDSISEPELWEHKSDLVKWLNIGKRTLASGTPAPEHTGITTT